ncbi:type I polyketide synthase [Pseudonocardia sichuanensis]|uniref:Acyl transferase domain-containing protein n=1 Tax=Pseudonocardia kunmingensis TaxID=630975 RepID=A0A543D9U8_9PSEU|nr:type I polyketide synthase [Pseudonocardia kunmingensis]TQM06117.1 acyl transferase domain-containing protein [Pseudonocardia kunmingensis]
MTVDPTATADLPPRADERSADERSADDAAVAVVGMAVRFPGAPDLDAFWALLRDGREGLTRLTDEELVARGVPAELRNHPRYVPVAGLIDGQDEFDPAPFGLTDADAALLDPQQRLFLQAGWQAFEDAGHGGAHDLGQVGVFAGAAPSAYLALNLADRYDPSGGGPDPMGSLQAAMGGVADYLPLQLAYRMNLTGPAIGVQTTCSTSLVAVHLAAQSLLVGECDAALAGGVSLIVPQGLGYLHVPDGIFSADGTTRSFGAGASGIVYTQGVGVVLLRRLADALADGDPIRAVIRGSAVNNDGAGKVGFTAPSPAGQARAIAEALAAAGVTPHDIALIEAHGTATALGDRIELAALDAVFGRADAPWCALGSVKSNIGHANSAAGIAALIKTVLALEHGMQPATLHADPPAPELGLDGSAFDVVPRTRPWPTRGGTRLAGVSSFGIGGTNCHVVVEQAPAPVGAPAPDPRPQLVMVSAATEDACRAGADRLAPALSAPEAPMLADAASTLHRGRRALPHRAAVVAADGREAADLLANVTVQRAPDRPPRLVVAFPGAGAQYAGMGAGLYADEPVFAAAIDECAAVFEPLLGLDIREIVTASPADGRARGLAADVRYGQPALFAVSLATARLLETVGVRPDVLVGHSLGEYAAAVTAGALDLTAAARLVAVRSLGIAEAAPGGMLAVPLGGDEMATRLARHPELDLAALNAPAATVVSGPAAAIEALEAELAAEGVAARRLAVAVALHSRAVEPVADRLRAAARGLVPRRLRVPVISTLTGASVSGAELADPAHWARHLPEPVRYADAVAAAVGDGPAVLVQAGPGTALALLASRGGLAGLSGAIGLLPGADDATPDRVALLDGLGWLWQRGIELDPGALHRPGRRRVRLPGYAFRNRRLWIDPPATQAPVRRLDPARELQVPVRHEVPRLAAVADRLRGRSWWVVGEGEHNKSLTETVAAAFRAAGAVVERHAAADLPATACPDGLVWLVGGHGGEDGPGVDGGDAARLDAAYADAAALAGRAAAWAQLPPLLAVARSVDRLPGDTAADPGAAAAFALVPVLAEEAGLPWRSVDLPGDDTSPALLLAEAADLAGDGESGLEVALRGGRRWSRTWASWQLEDLPRVEIPVAVVLGGLGRLGPLIAERLAAEHGARVVLASRRTAEPARRAIHELRERGFDVVAAEVDVTDPDAVRRLLAEAAGPGRPVDLVVHAAGAVGPDTVRPLVEKDPAGANTTAKVTGTRALHTAIEGLEHPPRLVLLASSVAATLGGVGLAEYAAANRYLDAWADERAADAPEGTRWLAVEWDTWAGDSRAGLGSGAAARSELPTETALAALDRLVALDVTGRTPPVVAVSSRDLADRSLQPTPGPEACAAVPVETSDAAFVTAAQQRVAALWSELLGCPVTAPDADFFALGGHSLLATRMLVRLRDEAGADLRLRDLVADPTVAGVAARLPETAGHLAAPSRADSTEPTGGTDPGEPFPLTRVQHAYWVGRTGAFGLGEVACHFYLEYDCTDLDLDRYERAWQATIARHPMLRAVVTEDGRNQLLAEVPAYRVRRHDLTALPVDEAEERLANLRRTLSHRVPRPDRWPLFDVRAALLPDGRTRLFVGVDALICDTASYFLIDAELHRRYADPDAALPALRTTFADHVADLERRRNGPDYERAVAYWRARLHTLPGPPSLPVRERAQARPWFGRRRAELDPRQWKALQEAAARHRVTPSAVLLTAYADLLAAWSGDDHFCVTVTLFDRPGGLPDIDQVVGDFTTLLLHEVDRDAGQSFADRAAATQRRMFDDLDHRDYSALEVLAARTAATGERHTAPVVFTSALGIDQVTGAEPDLEWAGRVVHGVSQTPQVWLDHQVYVQGGALQLQWDVLETAIAPEAADEAFAAYVNWLRRLADAAETGEPAAADDLWRDPNAGPQLTGEGVDSVAARLASIWAEVLDVPAERIAPDATFVSLGGDSVLAVRMAAVVRDRLGIAVPVAELIGDRPLSALAGQIADRLTAQNRMRPVARELVRRTDRGAPFPLTPLQQAYWVGQQGAWALSYDSAYLYVDFRLAGPGIEAADVRAAVRRLVDRQPMLRATFLPDGTQLVLDATDPALAEVPVTEVDLRGTAEHEVAGEVARIRAELQRTGPGAPPWPFAVTACRLPGDELHLHVVCSLLVADGWSFQLMFTELFTYLDEPNAQLPPLTAGFDDYVETITRQRTSPEWLAQRDWWQARLDELPPAPALPLARSLDEARPEAMTRRGRRVDAAAMATLRQRCTEHGVTPSAVFATCYAAALARLAGHHRFLLNVLYLNRLQLPADLDHVIGPYAATVLLDVDLPPGSAFVDACRRLQDELAHVLDHGMVTGVEVARELSRRRGDHGPQAPVVFHSTLGLRPPMSTPSEVEVRDFFQRVRTPQVALDLQVFEWDWDDDAVVNLDAVGELFEAEALDRLFAEIGEAVDALVADPAAWTAPVELPGRGLPAGWAGGSDDRRGLPGNAEPGAPETPTERRLAALWAGLLGLAPDGVDRAADFFELGGDSVLAIRMLGQLRREWDPDREVVVPPREFLRRPTVAALAAVLDGGTGADLAPSTSGVARGAADTSDLVVRLRDGSGGPLYLLPPTGGDVLCYAELARVLDTRRPVVGLQDPGLAGWPIAPDTVPDLARAYADAIRADQPVGPYLLGGWSMGGILAQEVARVLRADGADVHLLTLIDSNVADPIVDAPDAQFWARYLGSLEAFLDLDLGGTAFTDGLARLDEGTRRARVAERLVEAGLQRAPDDPVFALRVDAFRRHMRALAGHRTQPLDLGGGELLLVRADRSAPRNSGVGMGVDDGAERPDLGWEQHVRGALTVHGVDDHHYALLRPPGVEAVAAALAAALDRVEAKR